MNRNKASDDGPAAVAAAMQRVLQLQEDRAKRIKAVSEEHQKAVAELRSRTLARYRGELRQREKKRAQQVARIMSSVERRRDIEVKMQELVLQMHLEVRKVEEMMLVGYHGREMDVRSSMEGL
ncbi:hypothetical protein HRG_008058 [Hirsutella rhossiliensis]|uniref:Uncharacterized protein n=1 Tax=Hirsutella rhossiliensis TaxID=111463 RepID=A0A9P8SGW1_9HYPO|nr:uncharacterized protein HRG_08058 [Hirsutella rhossiliensis]KAH0960905.1 hypothetical protein HRG_08058 [Hirsutella rhossiliensis]